MQNNSVKPLGNTNLTGKKTKRLFKLLISTSFNYRKVCEITLTSIPGILQVKHLTQQELKSSQLRALSWQCASKECWRLKHTVIAFNMITASASVGRNPLRRKKDPRHKHANIEEYPVKKKYTMKRMCYFHLSISL